MAKNRLTAFIKYWGYRKWLAKINDPLELTHYLSGGSAELTQPNERDRYEQFKSGKTQEY